MNWSGMGVREYAAALQLSPYALRKWRDRLEQVEEEIDWRAHLHPSARAVVSTSARNATPESSLTDARKDLPSAPPRPNRRFFSDEQKLAIALETEQLSMDTNFPAVAEPCSRQRRVRSQCCGRCGPALSKPVRKRWPPVVAFPLPISRRLRIESDRLTCIRQCGKVRVP